MALGHSANRVLWGLVLLMVLSHGAGLSAQPLRPVPPVSHIDQGTDYSCGAAALATVLNHLGADPSTEARVIERLTQLGVGGTRVHDQGYSLAELSMAARSWGYASIGLKLTLAELRRLPLPAILRLHTSAGPHFSVLVAIEAAGGGEAKLADPSWGQVSLSESHLAALWLEHSGRGVALQVTPPAANVTRTSYSSE